ncbi:MAG: general substrate transporter [Monoraphidium minutum]|nr:MAG: general substrate transporter [Monoraphidium minutum]
MGAVLAAVSIAACGAFAFGYHLGVVNGPLEAIAKDLGFGGDKGLQGLVVSSTLMGAAGGSLLGGSFADALGRRASFMLCALPMLVGPLLSATATSLNPMVAGRFLAGVAIGLSSALVPLYISEVAPTKSRGTLGSLNQLMICFGILGALLVNVALPADAWRNMFMIAVAPAVLLFVGMLGCPESPVYLAGKGKRAEAEAVALKLWGPAGAGQLGAADAKGAQASSWSDLFAPGLRKGVLIGCMLFVFQQFSGINALIYFSSTVFKQAGITSGALASAAVGATNVAGTLIATGLIERAGRKQLLLQSYLGMATAMLVMAAGFTLPVLSQYAGPIALGGTLFYILSFAVGAGPVSGLIVPELNDARVRGNAVSAAMVTHWVCNVALGQNFMGWVDAFGLATVYAGFAAASLLGAAYIRANVPETKGKSFAEIQKELNA